MQARVFRDDRAGLCIIILTISPMHYSYSGVQGHRLKVRYNGMSPCGELKKKSKFIVSFLHDLVNSIAY